MNLQLSLEILLKTPKIALKSCVLMVGRLYVCDHAYGWQIVCVGMRGRRGGVSIRVGVRSRERVSDVGMLCSSPRSTSPCSRLPPRLAPATKSSRSSWNLLVFSCVCGLYSLTAQGCVSCARHVCMDVILGVSCGYYVCVDVIFKAVCIGLLCCVRFSETHVYHHTHHACRVISCMYTVY